MDRPSPTPDGLDAKTSVAAVHQVFALLRAVADSGGGRMPELAAAAGLSQRLTQRLLRTVAGLGYVHEAPGGWRLTARTFELGARALQGPDLVELAKPAMRALAASSGEAVQLGVREDDEIVCLHKIDSRHALGPCAVIGHREPLPGSAIGLALLACATDPGGAREPGLLTQRQPHLFSIAMPIFDHQGQAVAGLVVHVPAVRVDATTAAPLATQLRAATAAISQGLGFF